MATSETDHQHKGHYLGTEIDETWWKRYRKNKFFARGNGEYWFDDKAFYFRRYLTKQPLIIPFANVTELKTGKSHAGRWQWRSVVVKFIWQQDGLSLSSGFVVGRDQQETERVMNQIRHLIG
ncbi:MAG: hypothetical protein QNJ69_10450 [Gammaproteobacteria bacterium]|nr:hypothetical protein [Gammaproteobacteria bacterium]